MRLVVNFGDMSNCFMILPCDYRQEEDARKNVHAPKTPRQLLKVQQINVRSKEPKTLAKLLTDSDYQ